MSTTVSVLPVPGIPEVQQGDDLTEVLTHALTEAGLDLADGDVLVVASKIISKSLGLWADSTDKAAVVAAESVRVLAERSTGDRVTQIVQAAAGPVMAAAGVDASNTGGRDGLLLLPTDPDGEAERLRVALLAATGLTRLGVVVSDTSGRPWRAGQTDFALGAAGVAVLDDLRGGVDADGRPLDVTARAVADELAGAADLVKGKSDAVPVAVVRGSGWACDARGPGAGSLLRTGREDWFGYGWAESVRAALGTEPGSAAARHAGIASVAAEPVRDRVDRAFAVASNGLSGTRADSSSAGAVVVSAPTAYAAGVLAARLQVALFGERLLADLDAAPTEDADGAHATLSVRER